MSTHTPGPWTLDSARDGGTLYCQIDAQTPKELTQKLPAFGYTVADTMNRDYHILPEEDLANSRLIAAAPEMLAALELILSEMREGQDSPSLGAMQQVYAAVCKAKGEV